MGTKSTMEPWSRVPRNLTDDANNAIRDAILNDATRFAGGNIDAQISTRAIPGDQMALTPAERLVVQALIIDDITPFSGADIAAILTDTGAIVWGDITGIVNDIGVFPTVNYNTLALYVENIRTRLTTLQTDVDEGKLRAFKKVYTFAGTVESVANAAEVSLVAPAVVSPTFPAGATLTRAVIVASIKANNIAENAHLIGLTLQRNIAAGGWVDVTGYAFPGDPQPMSLPAVIGTSDAYTAVGEITFTTGQSIQCRWQVDSTNAGEVHYSQVFVLSVEYDFQ